MRARWSLSLFCLLGAVAVCGTAIAGWRPADTVVAAHGDPHTITEQRLMHELAASGLRVRYIESHRAVSAVAGVARAGTAKLGFEFQLFPRSDEATVGGVGRLRPADFGWPKAGGLFGFERQIRGVLANVAYAQYEEFPVEGHETRNAYLRKEADRRRIVRGLDDALFASLPSRDPYAHSIRISP